MAAEIPFQFGNRRVEIMDEALQVGYPGTSPGIDALVIIANHYEIFVALGNFLNHPILDGVGVL